MLTAATKEHRYELGVACVDTGCVRGFVEPMLGCDAQLLLLRDIDHAEIGSNGFAVHTWTQNPKGKARLDCLPSEDVIPDTRKRLWMLRRVRAPMAVALSWKGSWQGAWWDLTAIKGFLEERHELSTSDLATLKWLRAPIQHPDIAPTVRKAVQSIPRRFLDAWLGNSGLAEELDPRGFMEGASAVVRSLYWTDYRASPDSGVISWVSAHQSFGDGSTSAILDWAYTLQALCEISPILLRQGIEMLRRRRGELMKEVLGIHVRRTLGLPLDAGESLIHRRLAIFQDQIAERTTLSGDRIQELAFEHLQQLRERRSRLGDEYCDDMLEIAETRPGRRLLGAICGLHATEDGLRILESYYGAFWQKWKRGR